MTRSLNAVEWMQIVISGGGEATARPDCLLLLYMPQLAPPRDLRSEFLCTKKADTGLSAFNAPTLNVGGQQPRIGLPFLGIIKIKEVSHFK